MKIRPITFKQACEFINAQHRHHKSTVGCKFSVGLFEDKKWLDVQCVEDLYQDI